MSGIGCATSSGFPGTGCLGCQLDQPGNPSGVDHPVPAVPGTGGPSDGEQVGPERTQPPDLGQIEATGESHEPSRILNPGDPLVPGVEIRDRAIVLVLPSID